MAKSPDVKLWRAYIKADFADYDGSAAPSAPDEQAPVDILCPTMEADEHRDADVTYDKQGNVVPGGGTSLFDKDRFFAAKKWSYFYIPEETPYDPILTFTGPEWNKRFQANHYMIEPALGKALKPEIYRRALDRLATAALAKRYTDARKK
jgi:hypothetical protein